LRVFRGKPYPTLGELDVFAFVAAGFLADAFVDLDAVAAGTTERAAWTLRSWHRWSRSPAIRFSASPQPPTG